MNAQTAPLLHLLYKRRALASRRPPPRAVSLRAASWQPPDNCPAYHGLMRMYASCTSHELAFPGLSSRPLPGPSSHLQASLWSASNQRVFSKTLRPSSREPAAPAAASPSAPSKRRFIKVPLVHAQRRRSRLEGRWGHYSTVAVKRATHASFRRLTRGFGVTVENVGLEPRRH